MNKHKKRTAGLPGHGYDAFCQKYTRATEICYRFFHTSGVANFQKAHESDEHWQKWKMIVKTLHLALEVTPNLQNLPMVVYLTLVVPDLIELCGELWRTHGWSVCPDNEILVKCVAESIGEGQKTWSYWVKVLDGKAKVR